MANSDQNPAEDNLDSQALAVQRALGGKIAGLDLLRAHVTESGGESRPQQETMVAAVAESIANRHPLLAQAGTGTGKSLAYLFPLAASGKRGIIATATNQLSEQLIRHDLPQVAETMSASGKDLTFALLKGRNNYACQAKISEIENLNNLGAAYASNESPSDRLFEVEESPGDVSAMKRKQAKADAGEVGKLVEWSKGTESGDRSDAPPVPDRIWLQVSTNSADCPGAGSCPFGDTCFTEAARQRAKASQIVVTNHALLAQDVRTSISDNMSSAAQAGAGGVFGKHDVVIVDEAHDLPDALTGALSTEVDPRAIGKFLSKAAKYIFDETATADQESQATAQARNDIEHLSDLMESLPTGALESLPESVMTMLNAVTTRMITIGRLLAKASADATKAEKPKRAAAINTLAEQADSIAAELVEARTLAPGRVRWLDQRRPEDPPVLRTAPLEVGEPLNKALEGRTFIATSATLTVGGDFTPIQRTLGMDSKDVETLDVGSPFDYPKQGMLYIPKAPFPEPVGKDRADHTEAVLNETLALVTASGGRALVLFTTTAGAQRAAAHLREHLPHLNVFAHGESPADVLVRQFAEDETSVLCATMGLWQGTNVPGPSCSLVIIDKVGFAPVDDVLTAARRALADSRRRDGFTEVIVAQAATSLAQAAGRLIRTTSDRGVVAILDPRIHSKGYGRVLLRSLPDFGLFTDKDKVVGALERLTGGTTDVHRSAPKAVNPAPKSVKKPYSGPRRASATKNLHKNLKPRRID